MDLHAHHDYYCERVDPNFWAEPINALTNAAFLLAALLAYRQYLRCLAPHKASAIQYVDIRILIGLIAVIGVGSFLFHTVATTWAMLADVIPIALFLHMYVVVFGVRIAGMGKWSAMLLVAFIGLNQLVSATIPRDALNGSVMYAPAWLTLLAFSAYCALKHPRLAREYLWAAIVFTASLMLRSLDMAVCDTLPVGIHFFWHLFNGLALYIAVQALIRHESGKHKS